MYLDTDVVLAQLQVDDWLRPVVDAATLTNPRTSIVTALEVQLVMFDDWARADLGGVCDAIRAEGIELLAFTPAEFEAGAELLPAYASLNAFDAVHVGHARVADEPLVSTDTLFPRIDEIDHRDPRELT